MYCIAVFYICHCIVLCHKDESSSHEEDNGNSNSDCHQGKRKSRKLLNEDNPILLKDYEKKFIIERKGYEIFFLS